MTNIFDLLLDIDEHLEDTLSSREPDFNIDPQWNMILDIEYAQGEM